MGAAKKQPVTLSRATGVDRQRLRAWLMDKAQAEDDTAVHVSLTFAERRHEHPEWSLIASTLEVERHRDRARCFRSVAAALDRGEPDAHWAPDLGGGARKEEETVSGEHLIDRARVDREKKP
jgi:hypothetical protein